MKYLITGITGTLGRAVTKILLLRRGVEIVGLSRCEQKQKDLPKHKNLSLILGDIRDRDTLIDAARGVSVIFHFAALKCVDVGEGFPLEFIKTNVIGTENVLAAQRFHKIPRVVLSSTDKACYPINAYGATKALAEDLTLQNPNNVVCRYGNVVGSRGSVVPAFVNALKAGRPLSITDPGMTRFWIKIEDAAKFVVDSADGEPGLRIPEMRASKITDVSDAISKIMGVTADFSFDGMRPGEKFHECLRMENEGEMVFSNEVTPYSELELVELLRPTVESLL